MTHKRSVKLSDDGMNFLDRLRTNRRDPRVGSDKKDAPYWKLIEIIFIYFRENPKNYQDLLKQEYKKKNV